MKMKKGEVIVLNVLFSDKIKLPAMSGDQLYAVLSAKADLSIAAEEIEAKADKFRIDTKPKEVDEYAADMSDPAVKAWVRQFSVMRAKLLDEDFEGRVPSPCIDKDLFPSMAEGLTPREAMMIMNHLVKKE